MTFEQITEDGYIDLLVRRLHDAQPLAWITQARAILKDDIAGAESILDVGCATGYAAKSFPELAYTGSDVEPKYLAIARNHFAGNSRVNFIDHDLMHTPLPGHSDITLLNAVLEHCPTLSPALASWKARAGHPFSASSWPSSSRSTLFQPSRRSSRRACENFPTNALFGTCSTYWNGTVFPAPSSATNIL